MERNDISQLVEAGIPAALEDFSCGCWGKHAPPYIEDGQIVIEVGQGYRSNKHLHGQNVYVLETGDRVALIEMRKYGDLYGSGLWHYLVGIDGQPFVAQVSKNIDTLAEALESLKPAEVRRAKEAGKEVVRQGDWYFVSVNTRPKSGRHVEEEKPLDDDHVAEMIVRYKTVIYVTGTITHNQHTTIHLDGWHKAIQNKAIRTGRLARGGGWD